MPGPFERRDPKETQRLLPLMLRAVIAFRNDVRFLTSRAQLST
jgi:hypothetical protein